MTRSVFFRILNSIVRPGFIFSPEVNNLVVTGWEGSGSTFVYQVARKIGLNVKKYHGLPPQVRLHKTIYTYRDPRDVVCSIANRTFSETCDTDGVEKALLEAIQYFCENEYILQLKQIYFVPNVYVFKYETFINGSEQSFVKWLADQFFINLTDDNVLDVIADCSIEKNLKRSESFQNFKEYEKTYQIHGNHITSSGLGGRWKSLFTPKVEKVFKENIGRGLIDLGYEDSFDWSID